jgi:hypothetical protein
MKWLIAFTFLLSCTASAHSLSTAFMQLQSTEKGLSATLELSIADLQQALNWPSDRDVRWSDIQANKTQIENYLQQHLNLVDSSNQSCLIQTQASEWTAVEKNQGYYLSLPLFSTCNAQSSTLHYQVFRQLHDHKLLISWQQQQVVVSQKSPALKLSQVAP